MNSLFKIEKIKADGYYENFLKILEINPNFILDCVEIVEEPIFSTLGAKVIATTKIEQYTLIDLLKKDKNNEHSSNLLKILEFNSDFKIKYDSYFILDSKIVNFLGPELISKMPMVDKIYKNQFYAIIQSKYSKYLKSILSKNPNYNLSLNLKINNWAKSCRFWGVPIFAHIPSDEYYELDRLKSLKYLLVKRRIINDNKRKEKMINLMNEYIIYMKKSWKGRPYDSMQDIENIQYAEATKYSINKLINDTLLGFN